MRWQPAYPAYQPKSKYSELNLNQYSVGLPYRNVCTVCGSPPCPDLNLIHYIYFYQYKISIYSKKAT